MKKKVLIQEVVSMLQELNLLTEEVQDLSLLLEEDYKSLEKVANKILRIIGKESWKIGEIVAKDKNSIRFYSVKPGAPLSTDAVREAIGKLNKNSKIEFIQKVSNPSSRYITYESKEDFLINGLETKIDLIFDEKSYKSLAEISRDILDIIGTESWKIGEIVAKDENSIRFHPIKPDASINNAITALGGEEKFSKRASSFSSKYNTYESKNDFEIDGLKTKINLIFAVPETGALRTGKILGWGAEWAVWSAISSISLTSDKFEGDEGDKRIKTAFLRSSEGEKQEFLETLNSLSNSFKAAFNAKFPSLNGKIKSVTKPVSSTGEADVEVTTKNKNKLIFHVKYSSQRIGSIPLKNDKYKLNGKTASEIYRDLRDVNFPEGKFTVGKVKKFKKDLLDYKTFVDALIFGVKVKLGIGGTAGDTHIIVNFRTDGSVKLTKLGTQSEIVLTIVASDGESANPAFYVKNGDKIIANLEIHPKIYGSGKDSGKYLQIHNGRDFESMFSGELKEFSGAGAASGVSVPLGRGPDGEPDSRSASSILNKNAAVYGKSWGDAKPLKETIELLSLLKEESGK